jgi:ornithine cyclodeaminase/alanine dehydrogenase-like protein (mu-crystallin family)
MSSDDTPALRYLARSDVVRAAAGLDPVAVVQEALELHAAGLTTLPDEAYLPWHTSAGYVARSLTLPGALWGDRPVLGIKVINSSLANPHRALPRAEGLTMLFDRETALPVVVMEAAHLSALRTSAYTALSVRLLGPPEVETVAVIGCGALAAGHVRLLAGPLAGARFKLFDQSPERCADLVDALAADGVAADCRPVGSAEDTVRGSDVVITTTTTTTGYIPFAWLKPGALIAHVSLDDVLPDVVHEADLVVVDDWPLVRSDDRRLLGRMYRAGSIAGHDGDTFAGDAAPQTTGRGGSDRSASGAHPRRVDASLAQVITGVHPGRTRPDQVVLSNPFGMGILDVALADAVAKAAERGGLGTALPR